MKTPLCKICDKEGHYAYQCFQKKKNPIVSTRRLKSNGKHYKKWKAARRKWFRLHIADWYNCYLCGKRLEKNEVTLDHILPRSNRPDLRYEMSNLAPCCWECNYEKGSKH